MGFGFPKQSLVLQAYLAASFDWGIITSSITTAILIACFLRLGIISGLAWTHAARPALFVRVSWLTRLPCMH
jgi:hypothetical protein